MKQIFTIGLVLTCLLSQIANARTSARDYKHNLVDAGLISTNTEVRFVPNRYDWLRLAIEVNNIQFYCDYNLESVSNCTLHVDLIDYSNSYASETGVNSDRYFKAEGRDRESVVVQIAEEVLQHHSIPYLSVEAAGSKHVLVVLTEKLGMSCNVETLVPHVEKQYVLQYCTLINLEYYRAAEAAGSTNTQTLSDLLHFAP